MGESGGAVRFELTDGLHHRRFSSFVEPDFTLLIVTLYGHTFSFKTVTYRRCGFGVVCRNFTGGAIYLLNER